MILSIQFETLKASFFFGIYLSLIIHLVYKLTLKVREIYKIIISFVVIFFSVIAYFIILLKINNGIIHPYGLFTMLIGCLFEQYIEHFIEKHIKK